ncbi:hypothetical protein [Ammoniphilus resinae]|uniref:Polyferredoxin n=1 Tax=Ammoniphilus resinae TaxID=861532 RepID=A0ABS4GLN7_9BACL|nr:hypothetical protein [Ammoniphilus resinae]MBP1930820.1 polyferredoxin [Ammoniphilus resinae]
MKKHYVNLAASILFIIYSFWKLHHFFAPKVGPIGNGPSDLQVNIIWVLFSLSMILGFGVLFYSVYCIFKNKKES